jgi:hypothetical protein
MVHASSNLGRLGALALVAALAAIAAWTLTGQSDSSGKGSSHASQGLTNFSLVGSPPKSEHAHGAKQKASSGARGHEAPRRKGAVSAPVTRVPAISGPVPPRLLSSPVSADEVRAPSAKPGAGHGTPPPRRAPKGRSPGGFRLAPLPKQPRPAPRPGAPTGGTPISLPSNPPATAPVTTPTDPVTTPTDPGTTPTDPAGDPAGIDDTPVGGLDPNDLGEPVDETPDTGTAPAPAPAPGGAG